MKRTSLAMVSFLGALLSSCTTVTGTVDVDVQSLDTDKGMYNSPNLQLGDFYRIDRLGEKNYIPTYVSSTQPSNDEMTASPAGDETATISSGLNLSISVNPPDSDIQAAASADVRSGSTFTLSAYSRSDVKDVLQFAQSHDLLSRMEKGKTYWLVRTVENAASLQYTLSGNVTSSLKGQFPKVGSVDVGFTSQNDKSFLNEAHDKTVGKIPLFVKFSELELNDAGEIVLGTVALSPHDLDWHAGTRAPVRSPPK